MSFQIDQGLAQFDYLDHHAILGVPLGADSGAIRKRYLRIARNLHPDSRGAEADKNHASQLLSRLVNPAYETLSQEKNRAEHDVLLRLLGKRLVYEQDSLIFREAFTQELLTTNDPEQYYQQKVQELAANQYQALDQTMTITGQLSELNMAYLLRQETSGAGAAGNTPASPTPDRPVVTPSPATAVTTPTANPQVNQTKTAAGVTFVSQYCRRAEEFIAKNNFQSAVLELRDALKLEPQNSRCHSLLGTVYLKQNQLTMAKVHFNQALKQDPKEAGAILGLEQIKKLEVKAQKTGKVGTQGDTSSKPKGGGIFGLFGGKKK